MRRQSSSADFEQIERVLSRHLNGLHISVLEAELGESLTRRTLNRRLTQLITQRRVERRGRGKSSIYVATLLALSQSRPAAREFESPDGGIEIPLSRAARDQLDYVSRPVAMRTRVTYERGLLDDYVPNRTSYLSNTLKAKLHRIGKPIDVRRSAGTFARDILARLLIDLSWASSRLEGNTYTRLDTQRLIDYGQEAVGKDAKETRMILNHKDAIQFAVEGGNEVGVNAYTVLNLHALLSDDLMADPESSGRLRRRAVEIGKSAYTPLAVPQLVAEHFEFLLEKAASIHDPFETAFFLMVHIPYLQPFEDVNKRVSRLAANVPLIKANLCPLSFIDVPESAYVAGTLAIYEMRRYELLRDVFEWAYEKSCQQYVAVRDSLAPPDAFRGKHKSNLTEVIGKLVRGRANATAARVRTLAKSLVDTIELDRFVDMTRRELDRLYEGNIARYKIKPAEFQAWKKDKH